MKIGQRKALSDLDLAQLRAMYYCNAKDKEKRSEFLSQKKKNTFVNS